MSSKSKNGWVKIWRKMLDGDLDCDFFTWSLFTRLIFMANWKPGKIKRQGQLQEVQRGEIVTSIKKLAQITGSSRNRISRHLQYLTQTGRISYKTDTKGTWITILNYSKYQDVEVGGETSSGAPNGTPHEAPSGTRTKKDKKERRKEGEEDKECTTYTVRDNPAPHDKDIAPPKKVAKYKYTPAEMDLATEWASVTAKKWPHVKRDAERWAHDIGVTKRSLGFSDQQMEALMRFIYQDEFWRDVVQSPLGLRRTSKNGLRKVDNILAKLRKKHYSHADTMAWAKAHDAGQPVDDKEYAAF